MSKNVFVLLRNLGNDWPEIKGVFLSEDRAKQAVDAMNAVQQAKHRLALLLSNAPEKDIEGCFNGSYEYRIEEHAVHGWQEEIVETQPEIKPIYE